MMTSAQATTTTTTTQAVQATGAINAAEHVDLVKRVAKRIARRLPSVVDIEDLVGAGAIGLMDAAARYDVSRCGSFAPYAEIRIRGAILDHLRAMDWLPRSMRTKNRRVDDAERRLKHSLGRAPDATELANFLGVPEKSIAGMGGAAGSVVSVEDLREDGFDSFQVDAPAPGHALESRERKERLTAAIAQLPLRTRQILSLYYVEDLTLKQIGVVFNLTESRACQLHGQALAKLRAELIDDVEHC